MSGGFAVVGSINMDLVTRVDRFPHAGETRIASGFGTYPGGKGANQAVALARLGADVGMIGKVGDDVYGTTYRETFDNEGVNHSRVQTVAGTSTGVAVIEVNESGENRIAIARGANAEVDRTYIDAVIDNIAAADFVLFQLEIPLETIRYALTLLRDRPCTTILDPAPAPNDDGFLRDIIADVDVLTPNEHEIEALTGITVTDASSAEAAAHKLMRHGVGRVIVKMGGAGACVVDQAGTRMIEGFSVDVADTTAAGDAFNAGFAYALGTGRSVDEAVRFGNAVGAVACTGFGAQSALPTRDDVERVLSMR